jgi:hypothetical protein
MAVPHVILRETRVPSQFEIFPLNRIVAEVYRLVAVLQRELLRAEPEVTLAETEEEFSGEYNY